MTRIARQFVMLLPLLALVMTLSLAAVHFGETAFGQEARQQVREGSLLESNQGKFEDNGDHVNFFPGHSQAPIRCLENLALERIVKQLAGIGRDRQWIVTGTLTEYQGRNYLLVSRAVLRNRAAP